MKNWPLMNSVAYLLLLISIGEKLYSQDHHLDKLRINKRTIAPNLSTMQDSPLVYSHIFYHLYPKSRSNNAFIKAKIDSIRSDLIKDSVGSGLIFLNIDVFDENAYGCFIRKNREKLRVDRIVLVNDQETTSAIDSISIRAFSQDINELFSYPDRFLENFLSGNAHPPSHDNEIYFFLKVDGEVFFDRFFMRSAFVGTPNNEAGKLIELLGSLYYVH